MKMLPAASWCLLLLAVAGCAHHPISRQLREEADRQHIAFSAVLANPAAHRGAIVLWGGKIISLTALPRGSELVVLETDLDSLGRPRATASSQGRFIARTRDILEPAYYKPGSEIVLAGAVLGADEAVAGPTGEALPAVCVKELYLWDDYYYRDSSAYYWIDVH